MVLLINIVIIMSLIVTGGNSQMTVGCGGYVKSQLKLQFERMKIQLLSNDGNVRDVSEVFPNGAYSIPVYDKGDYLLKLDAPAGWSFEPNIHEIKVTDQNSCSKDYNFVFKGFIVTGQVFTRGLTEGPSGVALKLLGADRSLLSTNITSANGYFSFGHVLPGEYIIIAEHKSYVFVSNQVQVTVNATNIVFRGRIEVKGYTVEGKVLSDGEPIKGVKFFLISPQKLESSSIDNCNPHAKETFPQIIDKNFVCYVESGEDGKFRFSPLPGGKYVIIPFYKGEKIIFDILPTEYAITVTHDHLELGDVFQVAGFSVSGRVILSEGGNPLSGAKIFVNDKFMSSTSDNGVFHLEGMRAGKYVLTTKLQHYYFEPKHIIVSPTSPELPSIIPEKVAVCGRVVVDRPASVQGARKLVVSKKTDIVEDVSSRPNGEFCVYLPPGKYTVRPIVTDAELEMGIKLAPLEKEIVVQTTPITNLKFSQFRAMIYGRVVCIGKCKEMDIKLVSLSDSSVKTVRVTDDTHVSQFQFFDIVPGKYIVKIGDEDWCWKEKEKKIEIVDKNIDNLAFSQIGFKMYVTSSHPVQLRHTHVETSTKSALIDLNRGIDFICVSLPGEYSLHFESCNRLEQSKFTYNTEQIDSGINVIANEHQASVRFELESPIDDIKVKVKSEFDSAELEIRPSYIDKTKKISDASFWYKVGDTIIVEPSSSIGLFTPEKALLTLSGNECKPIAATFTVLKGKHVNGVLSPVVVGVSVLIKDSKTGNILFKTQTDQAGKFKVGPLAKDAVFVTELEKSGFKFVEKEVKGDVYLYTAVKLAEVEVNVQDEKSKTPLLGVLLSLIGDDYRSNGLTGEDGKYSFVGLNPGTYYIRAMMKEYEFNPADSIRVQEGKKTVVTITGSRVAYSVEGTVISLNEEPEANVVVEAISPAGLGKKCIARHTETASTDDKGHFRIRGLKPECNYHLLMDLGHEKNKHIDRFSPNISITMPFHDVTNLLFYAIRKLNMMEISAVVDTPDEKVLQSLRLRVFPESHPDNMLYTHYFSKSLLFYMNSLPADDRLYVLRLESSLPSHLFSFKEQEQVVRANGTHQHFVFTFEAKLKHVEQELSVNSLFTLPLLLAIALVIWYREKIIPHLSPLLDAVRRLLEKQRKSQTNEHFDPQEFSDISPYIMKPATPKKQLAQKQKKK